MRDTEQNSKDYIKKFDITYPNGLDKNGTITVDYGVIGLPVTFFVNREGIVERRWVGAIREEQLVTWVKELSSGTPPSEEAEGQNPEDYVGFK
jgi:cytochrome c biogenesis protein CcmG/thiol:disulfide interchange protein DsbE